MRRLLAAFLTAILLTACGDTDNGEIAASQTTAPVETTVTTEAEAPDQTDNGEIAASQTTAPVETTVTTEAEAPDQTHRRITVGGMGSQYAEPIRCTVNLSATSRRPTVEAASKAAADTARAITGALTSAGVASSDIQTSSFSINPVYEDYPRISGYATEIGYLITLPDIDGVGAVLAEAVAAGGDDVRASSLRFETDPTGLMEEARSRAWADVEARATALAALAGEPLGVVLDAHEKVLITSPQGMAQGGEGDSASFDIPVSPGVTGVVVLLTVTYSIGE